MLIGEDPRKAINDYSRQFLRDFLQLLRTGHGEKKINVNHFYQEYIANKSHIHMNSTKWNSLTELAKYLGREGICRVEESEGDENGRGAGLMISWVDNSPEALRRQNALATKERQDRGDEEREQRAIREQILRARKDGLPEDDERAEEDESAPRDFRRPDGEKIKLNFTKKIEKPPSPPLTESKDSSCEENVHSLASQELPAVKNPQVSQATPTLSIAAPESTTSPSKNPLKPISLSSDKPKNVFAAASKKSALGGSKKLTVTAPQKPLSEAERIMKEEIEQKRLRETNGRNNFKRQRVS